ncbi:pyridoxal phosphate-dependent aminotransferase [Kiloniella laminariae]|uniref:Pyridoxal phosphate-dependent aminotransferase n=1 Tax=Kiloniella laminariae TaxID=454162 RepID=A0ABT4LIS8_9PROT|nr:pyridoxal phosphate-dependent aminotransferase [Kiloniella laminariae]MCZ4279897.1 pyridoxal phosphate-dependent aminotransferase [Kiloniella laminariae]
MSVSRLKDIPGIGVDKMGNAADASANSEMLRLENLDTDIPPPAEAIAATKASIGRDDANSYLPFLGINDLRKAVCKRMETETGSEYNWRRQCVISAGGLSGILNSLLAMLEPGDEVIITDPAYAGLLNRIRLAGGIPKLVPLIVENNVWRLDIEALYKAVSNRTTVVLTMSPSMPSGIVHTRDEWNAITDIVIKNNAWLLHDAAMQRLDFTNSNPINPAGLPDMLDRTVIVGSVSKEYRMIGWRVGWVVGPPSIIQDIGLVSLTNVVCQVGIAMPGAYAALTAKDDGVIAATAEWKTRRDLILDQCQDLPLVRPDGGWSLLINTGALGMSPGQASKLCFEKGAIAATPMTGWGDASKAGQYLRFVFANEPTDRLSDIRERLRQSWNL